MDGAGLTAGIVQLGMNRGGRLETSEALARELVRVVEPPSELRLLYVPGCHDCRLLYRDGDMVADMELVCKCNVK